jgi:hypothetical protein
VLADCLVAEVDERCLACAQGRRSSLVRTRNIDVRARGERTPEAGSRRQSRDNGGGLLVIPCASGVEGALVDGRHPGVWTSSPLTRGRGKHIWLSGAARLRSRGGGARHRVSEAMSRARRAVENTAAGRRRSEGPSIAAPARNERYPFAACPRASAVVGQRARSGLRRSWRFAVKRSSTRDTAGGSGRRRVCADRRAARFEGGALENRSLRRVLVS